jgi:hypothetical protein
MPTKHQKKLKRQRKKKEERKLQVELEKLKKEENLKVEAKQIHNQQKVQEIREQEYQHALQMQNTQNPNAQKIAVNYVADRNGCGYFRCIWPFELLATYKNIMGMNCFVYQNDPNIVSKVGTFRFQRQATDAQTMAWNHYLNLKKKGFKFNLQYEIDDLLMEIMPHNEIAYKYFDQKKKDNHMHMLRTADSITFSTEPLKEIYVEDYGIEAEKIKVVRNYLPQFLYSLPYRNAVRDFNTTNKKPRIFWSGSASHLGKGGDLEFLMEMIRTTIDEYQWVFQGVIPPEFTDLVKEGKIEFIPWAPIYGLANVQFYRAKPDITIAPLVPNRFNSAKSDLKYLESCALGAPCITTSFEEQGLKSPYDRTNAEICVEPDADIWKSMIDHLVGNSDYFMEVTKKQYQFLNGRWMENNLEQWMGALDLS